MSCRFTPNTAALESFHTLGIDLAAQAKQTAACSILWEESAARLLYLEAGLDDDALFELIDRFAPIKIAIDAPFGWPTPFAEAVEAHRTGQPWPAQPVVDLRLRATDQVVIAMTRQQPLSVSSDRIAVAAFRCARLLTRLGANGFDVRRDGAGVVAEVYPAAALTRWGFSSKGYKGTKPQQVVTRTALVASLATAVASWLTLAEHDRLRLVSSDHLLDALLCAIVGHAVAVGATQLPEAAQHEKALAEGWIHLPAGVDLRRLPTTTGLVSPRGLDASSGR